jgi:hypothetical protein
MIFALDDTRPGNEKKISSTDYRVPDLEAFTHDLI